MPISFYRYNIGLDKTYPAAHQAVVIYLTGICILPAMGNRQQQSETSG
jgi:hypothetical protein